ncbi:MAG: ASPIC/UnbV domain-containing protein [Armatimonadetes bacterium]|nr:ASPIC/UnbV domain-containing protein [Armatimonadota bacterium]
MDVEGRTLLLQNNAKNTNHFLTLKLQGTKSNRDAIGAIVMIEAGGKRWRQDVSPTGSFLSSHDIRVHIGLGSAKQADKIEVRWTSGLRQTLTNIVGDRFLTLVEGQGVTETGKGK